MAMEILVPNAAIRNLIREDKIHQIYSMMQSGQSKFGMQTFNQSLATLYLKKLITLEPALSRSSMPDELQELINRGVGVNVPTVAASAGKRLSHAELTSGRDATAPGIVQEGVLAADTKEVALATLRRQNIVVTGIRERGKEISLSKMGRKVPSKILAVFTRQFSVMIDAGLPLVQCLEILANQQEHKNFAKILLQVRQDVEAGSTLADAMRRHPKAFDDLYVNMVAAGEAGGILDTILQRLSTYIEKAVKLRAQVRAALIYPVAVICIAAIVVAVILLKVIPTFAALFTSLGAELPFPTRVVIVALELHSPATSSSSSSASPRASSSSAATTRPTAAAASSTGRC